MENTRRTIRELFENITHGKPYSPFSKVSDKKDLHKSADSCQPVFFQLC